ncbi:hypothetical protein [Actinomadura sp. WMMA1423]|uniref:hypothetical protein n=1 Tax=Actinomadura sp. WMMA1423 TaxID=2591108 RepID=UPI0011471D6F|nr:hypothetical protein [Actinomadura sp. WMMA1423]
MRREHRSDRPTGIDRLGEFDREGMADHCRVGDDDVLLVNWPRPVPEAERIVLRHEPSGEVRGGPLRDDRRSAAVPVAGLAPGTWDVLLGGDRPLLTEDPGFSYDGLLDYAARARERALRVVRRPDGLAVLDVREVSPHAEVEAVHPRDGGIGIVGRLAYAGPRPGGAARLVAVARDGGGRVSCDARLDGTGFDARLDVHEFARREPALWDLWLDVADVHARLATFLDDAPGKRGTLSYPRQIVEGGERGMSVRPYYTLKDELSVACHLLPKDAPSEDGTR